MQFEPCESNGVYLTREGLLGWLDDLVEAYGEGTSVQIRLYCFTNGRGFRDMLSNDVKSSIGYERDAGYESRSSISSCLLFLMFSSDMFTSFSSRFFFLFLRL